MKIPSPNQTILKKYRLENETYFRTAKNNPADKIEVIVGDDKQPDFKPQFKVCRWDNEVNFSIRAEEHPGATVRTQGEKIKYITPEYEVHQYDKPDASEDGGWEFEWVLPRKPKDNVLRSTIQTKGLDFFYQPELEDDEVREMAERENISLLEAKRKCRPENVVGSYAVYHKEKQGNYVGGKEYKCGKAFHIYRPKAIDAQGKEVWCELNIDEEKGLLTVTVPQEFLNSAVYPVIVDPTFGYSSIGASSYDAGGGSDRAIFASKFLGVAGMLDSISWYVTRGAASDDIKAGLYKDSDKSLVAGPTEKANIPATAQWHTINFSSESLTGVDYWISVSGNRTGYGGPIFYYDTGSANQGGRYSNGGYYPATWPNPITWTATDTKKFSTYVTYTAGGGSTAPTVTTQAVSDIAQTTATGNGNVTADGGATITERGVCWNTTGTPTTADSKATSTGTTGAFTASMTGLTANTTYYVRAYAINSEGTSYGDEVSFTTSPASTAHVKNLEDTLIVSSGWNWNALTQTWDDYLLSWDSYGEYLTTSKTSNKTVSDSLSMAESVVKDLTAVRNFSESVSLAESKTVKPVKNLSDTITTAESVSKRPTRTISEALSLTESASKVLAVVKSLTDAVSLTEAIIRRPVKRLSESLNLSENLSSVRTYLRDLSDSLSLADIMTTANGILHEVSDSIGLSDVLSKKTTKNVSDSLTLTENLSKKPKRTLSDSVSLTENVTFLNVLRKTLTDSLNLADSLIKKPVKRLSDALGLTDVIQNGQNKVKNLADSLSLTDTGYTWDDMTDSWDSYTGPWTQYALGFETIKGQYRILSDSFSLADSVIFGRGKILLDYLGLTDHIKNIYNGSSTIWRKVSQVSTIWTARTKPDTSYTSQDKPSTNYTNYPKP